MAKPKSTDTLPVPRSEEQIPIGQALEKLFDSTLGFKVEKQGTAKESAPDGTVVKRFASSAWKLNKADLFTGADGEAKEAARKTAALTFKKGALALVNAGVMADDAFIPTQVRTKTTEKTQSVAMVFHKVRVIDDAERLAMAHGGDVAYWRKIIDEASVKIPETPAK